MTLIEIHEFSTGVIIQGTPYQWWIADFMKDDFMNLTLNDIPHPVYRAISQELLKIYEFPENSRLPVIIGREVKSKKEAWSVLAVVTLAENDRGNKIPVYRYFITEGLDRIPDILTWYNRNRKPVFAPFDKKIIGQPYYYDDVKTIRHDALTSPPFQDLLTATRQNRLVIPSDINCPPIILHQLAEKIKKKKQLIAWASNVKTILKPRTFNVLHLSPSSQLVPTTKPESFWKKLINPIIIINHNVTSFINQIYHSLVDPIGVPPILLFLTFVAGSILIGPTFLIAFFSTQFFYGLIWGFGIIFIFFFGLEIGRRIK